MSKNIPYLISGAILFLYYVVIAIVNFVAGNELYGFAHAFGALISIILTCIEILIEDVRELKKKIAELNSENDIN